MKQKQANHFIRKDKIWKVAVGGAVLIYLGLTTAIFVVHKKIDLMKDTQGRESQKTPANHQNTSSIQGDHQTNRAVSKGSSPENSKGIKNREEMMKTFYEQEEKIIEQCRKRIESNPNDIEAHLSLAQFFMRKKESRDKALEHLRKVREIEPNHPKNKMIEAWINHLEKELDENKKK